MTPLTPLTFHSLLALAGGEQTATEIKHQIAVDTQSTFLPEESAFYKALRRMTKDYLIESAPGHRYRLTNRGRMTLQAEKVRLQRADYLLRQRLG